MITNKLFAERGFSFRLFFHKWSTSFCLFQFLFSLIPCCYLAFVILFGYRNLCLLGDYFLWKCADICLGNCYLYLWMDVLTLKPFSKCWPQWSSKDYRCTPALLKVPCSVWSTCTGPKGLGHFIEATPHSWLWIYHSRSFILWLTSLGKNFWIHRGITTLSHTWWLVVSLGLQLLLWLHH